MFNNRNIIKKILFEEDEIIKLENEVISDDNYMRDYFYLYKLITDDLYIINYSYKYDLVKKLKENIEKEKSKLKKYILNIFAYSIVNTDFCLDGDKNKLNKISKEIEEFLKNQQSILKEFNINLDLSNYQSFKIDNIYSAIIISLIKNKKLEDFEYSENIMKQLGLDNIELTEEMFNILYKEFKDYSNKEYIECYKITSEEHLLNNKYINFYYILFKYIFKTRNYIIRIKYFYDARKSINNIIQANGKILDNLNERLEEILKKYLNLKIESYNQNEKEEKKEKERIKEKKKKKEKVGKKKKKKKKEKLGKKEKEEEEEEEEEEEAEEKEEEEEEEEKEKKEEKEEEKKISDDLLNNKIKIFFKTSNNVEDIEILIECSNNNKYFYSESILCSCKEYFLKSMELEYIIFDYLTEFLDRLKNEYINNSELIIDIDIKQIDNEFEFIYSFDSHSYKDLNYINEKQFYRFIEEFNSEKYSLKSQL